MPLAFDIVGKQFGPTAVSWTELTRKSTRSASAPVRSIPWSI